MRNRETRDGVTRPLIIATLMRAEGDTGVQTHVRAVMEALRSETGMVELVTPYNAPRWQVYPIFALRRIIDPLWKTASVCWYRYWHAAFVHMMLRRRLAGGEPCTVYAQCPLSAHAALRARVNRAQRVVMVVHFNVSQADEWAGKGMIKHDGAIAERIRTFEARVLPQLDGIIHVSNFMAQALQRRVPASAEVASAIVPNFIVDPGPRADWPLEGDLLCIGALEPRKNQRYAIEILAAAKRLGTQFKLTLVGDGPDRGGQGSGARSRGRDASVLRRPGRGRCRALRASPRLPARGEDRKSSADANRGTIARQADLRDVDRRRVGTFRGWCRRPLSAVGGRRGRRDPDP